MIAIFIGPFQFIEKLRSGFPKIHRWSGYVYIASVFMSSICGFIVAQYAMGGIISTVGFSLLAIVWFYSTFRALTAILNKKIFVHRRNMFFSYAFTFAAIPQRTLLLLPLLLPVDFMPIYRLSAWLPWIVSALIAYLLARKYSTGSQADRQMT